MTNSIALTLEQERFGNGRKKETKTSSLVADVKKIANDSLFFFGIFLVAVVGLQYIPVASGLFSEVNIGINEVAVSILGFVNVFFIQLFSKKLNKSK
ncbi:MAG: hypothetical protein GY932_04420 [Arcobacter sp.]|nr:hypothetical protein [Arcobacter sp.]